MSNRQSRSGNQCKSLLDSIPVHAEIDILGNEAVPVLESLLRNRRTAQSGAYTKRRKARAKRLIGHKEIFSAREVRSHFVEMDSGVNVC